jgi:hypothetical protein
LRDRGYAATTVAHSETVLRGFYDFHRDAGSGPVVNPFPLARQRHEHQLRSDHASIRGLAHTLGTLFWRDLEIHEPGISSIKLTPAAAARWKQRIQVKTTTAPAGSGGTIKVQSRRSTAPNILLQVRAFYLDLAQWAADDPARWGPWAVPCPVRDDEIGYHKEASRRKARMDQRTRERLPVLPVLPALVAAVDRERERAAALLAAAQAVRPGQLFTAGTETFRRSVTTKRRIVRIWCEPPGGGPRTDLTLAEHQAFWTWAAVEVLRHTGVPGRTGGLPRRSPLRTVRATHCGTRLKQAARALQVEAPVSCAGGRGARGDRRRVRGGSGHRPVSRVARDG